MFCTGIKSAWLGVHFIDGQYRNVNGDDFLVGVLNDLSDPPEDSCLQLMLPHTDGQNSVYMHNDSYSFHSCDTSISMAGICTRSKHGIYLILSTLSIKCVELRNKLLRYLYINTFTPCNSKSVSSMKTCTVTVRSINQ